MQPELYRSIAYCIDTQREGMVVIPHDKKGLTLRNLAEYLGDVDTIADDMDYSPDDPLDHEEGWVYRMSMPGYLDSTDWGIMPTEAKAIESLLMMYGDDDCAAGWEDDAITRLEELGVDTSYWRD